MRNRGSNLQNSGGEKISQHISTQSHSPLNPPFNLRHSTVPCNLVSVAYLHQRVVQLLQHDSVVLQILVVAAVLEHQIDDVVLDALALLDWQDLPAELDQLAQDSEREEARELVLGVLENGVHTRPRRRVLLELRQNCLCVVSLCE